MPSRGGDTCFSNACLAYEALPAALRARLDRYTCRHSYGYSVTIAGTKPIDDTLPHASHPLVRIMPETGRILNVGDITKVEPNIHAGVKHMRSLMNTFFENEPMDELNKGLFTFAAYNAGGGRVRQLRKEAEQRGLNPNIWFGNVEQIASERIGRETVTYVANIFKYYVAYRLVLEETERRAAAKAAVRDSGPR